MNNKNILIVSLAFLLILIGLIKPDLSNWVKPNNVPSVVDVVVDPPSDPALKEKADLVVKALLDGGSDRVEDGKKLGSLYSDIATLIELDGENEVIKNTDEIRQANAIAGVMLRLDIKGKYSDLAVAAKNLIVTAIGDENAVLSKDLRKKATESFRALSWACYEGSK